MASVLHTLNSPAIKEGIKNTIGPIAFAGGILEVAVYCASRSEPWHLNVDKTLISFMRASVLLSCIMSRPGLRITEIILHRIATPATLAKIFGENTIFEKNPRHPRHLANVTANILSAAGLLHLVYSQMAKIPASRETRLLQCLAIFNFFTGRSTLHLANDAGLYVFKTTRKGI